MLPYKTSSLLSLGVVHGFFSRYGGVSAAPFDALNTSFTEGDDPDAVLHNRQHVLQTLHLENSSLVTVHQVHGTNVLYIGSIQQVNAAIDTEADALVTDVPGIVLGVQTADCAPIMLHDPEKRRVAAVHAGWKGAFLGVAEKVVQTLIDMGSDPRAMQAIIGPCIHQESYGVSADFRQQFVNKDTTYAAFFRNVEAEGCFFDLPGFLKYRLQAMHVKNVEVLPYDTYADRAFFSFRRAQEETKGLCGRQISVIALLNSCG
ncbi:MAG: peptidoglycan editing factor PgeF [Holosporales bacterium]|jgi:YfiH family protein|nr:peptidoglycan editing factor PgeF [Holosporales bacterium]